jgi:shikimate 5-dehydrogenase
MGTNAKRARAVNTLVNLGERMLADNTDVDGFAALLPARAAVVRRAAVLGAGGTARAALVALQDAGIAARMFSRKGGGFDALAGYGADLVINTLPGGADVAIPRCETYIEAAYGGAPRAVDAQHHIGGLDLLHAQAVRQHALFMKVFDAV